MLVFITVGTAIAGLVPIGRFRYGTAADGENHWNRRRSFLIETIRAQKSDLLTRDTFRVLHPERTANERTFSGFKSEATSGACIDWIGACGNLGVLFLGGKRPDANLDTIAA